VRGWNHWGWEWQLPDDDGRWPPGSAILRKGAHQEEGSEWVVSLGEGWPLEGKQKGQEANQRYCHWCWQKKGKRREGRYRDYGQKGC